MKTLRKRHRVHIALVAWTKIVMKKRRILESVSENIIEKRQENRFWQSEEAIKIDFFALKANMEYCILF